ncbi:hypothetical protein KR018_003293 [Drosophila ironensis]|nr:hypothetical protein KR018_003293 [Drosophila ironensis]
MIRKFMKLHSRRLNSVLCPQLRWAQTAPQAADKKPPAKAAGKDAKINYFAPPKGSMTNSKTSFGPLKDCDRVFQNLYGRHDWRLAGACERGDWHRTGEILELGPDWVMEQIRKCAMRGRGGAGFYCATKWEFLRNAKVPKMLVVNCAEGEPGTCKDREILRHEPHKLLEGILLVGTTLGCSRAIIYVRNRFYNEACNLHFALAEAYYNGLFGDGACGTNIKFDVMVQRGDRYLCGEETAMLNCLMGEQGRPRRRPPYLTDKGYFAYPCLVINAESISVVPTILRRGPGWWSGLGRSYNSGTKLFCISGHVNNPCTVEEEMSTPLRDIIECHAGGVMGGWDNLLAVWPGGLSCPLLDAETASDVLMDYDCLKQVGSTLGCGSIIVMSKDCDPLEIMLRSIEFFAEHTCKQCTYCRDSAIWFPEMFERFVTGEAHPHEIEWVSVIADKLKNSRPICGLSGSQVAVAESMVRLFSKQIEKRILRYASATT